MTVGTVTRTVFSSTKARHRYRTVIFIPAPAGSAPVVGEMELLYLADKLCRRGEVVMPEDTLRALESRFSDNHAALESARGRMIAARVILDTLQSQYGISFTDL